MNLDNKIEVTGSSVDFYSFKEDGIEYFYFDSSMTSVPEPMVNAMCGLKLLENQNQKLIMINHMVPQGLLNNLNDSFGYDIEHLDDGNFKIIFSYIDSKSKNATLKSKGCSG